jgi:fluoride exporter
MTALLVALGAAVGATLRFWVGHHLDERFPTGTLLVNVGGSFILGLVLGGGVSAQGFALLGTGLCGGLTTYSAFAVQTRDQALDHGTARGVAYAATTIVIALAASALGYTIGQATGQA